MMVHRLQYPVASPTPMQKVLIGERLWDVDHANLIDISLFPSDQSPGVTAFGVPPPVMETIVSVADGARCNSYSFRGFAPHIHGTHAETRQHLLLNPKPVVQQLKGLTFVARLITADPLRARGLNLSLVPTDDDRVITREQVEQCLAGDSVTPEVLIIRTPHFPNKRNFQYGGTNPPYPHHEVAQLLVERGVQHVVLDCPSADREQGELFFHRTFWQDPVTASSGAQIAELSHVPSNPRDGSLIVELAFIPDEVADGWYLLYLCPIGMPGDAAPIRPLIVPIPGFPGKS